MVLVPGDPFMRRLPESSSAFAEQLFEEAKMGMAYKLVRFNLGIFVLAGAAGYFLAGRTLRPIETMVDEQKRFVADASHELRTPLTAMRTEVEVALRDKEFDTTYAKEVLESNLEEIGKLQQLSDYLLTLGRFQNANKNRNFTEISLIDVVNEAYQDIEPLARAGHIEIQSDIGDVALEAEKESLAKLLIIFLDNAIKYSPSNGKIILRAQAIKNKVVITVQDFGAGIRAGDLPYIFNRFYRADASRTKAKVDGYGLGLSIAKSIIDTHNGKVNVESTPNEGTTFTIILPRKQ
jgi:signal transduction histidine kinase